MVRMKSRLWLGPFQQHAIVTHTKKKCAHCRVTGKRGVANEAHDAQAV